MNCKNCSKAFKPAHHYQVHCSVSCRDAYGFDQHMKVYWDSKPIPFKVKCAFCKKTFKTTNKRKTTCSSECQHERRKITSKEWLHRPENTKHLKKYSDAYEQLPKRKASIKKRWGTPKYKRMSKDGQARYRKTPHGKIANHLRQSLHARMKVKGHTSDFMTYTAEELKSHIESLWLPGMSWENHSKHGWHIDHIKPLSKFNFFNKDGSINKKEVCSAMSLKNLQPLWAVDNHKKYNKYQEASLCQD